MAAELESLAAELAAELELLAAESAAELELLAAELAAELELLAAELAAELERNQPSQQPAPLYRQLISHYLTTCAILFPYSGKPYRNDNYSLVADGKQYRKQVYMDKYNI